MDNLIKIRAVLDKVAQPYGIVVTDILWQSGNILEIPIMFEDGSMDLETCGIMSQQFIDALENVEELDFDYSIDVCSPGAERELKSLKDIEREINNHVYVKLKNPKAGFFEIVGTLAEVSEDNIKIEYMEKTRKKSFEIAIDNISLIRLAVKI